MEEPDREEDDFTDLMRIFSGSRVGFTCSEGQIVISNEVEFSFAVNDPNPKSRRVLIDVRVRNG